MGEIGDMNLYAFVYNNPVNFVDPWGLETSNYCHGECTLDGSTIMVVADPNDVFLMDVDDWPETEPGSGDAIVCYGANQEMCEESLKKKKKTKTECTVKSEKGPEIREGRYGDYAVKLNPDNIIPASDMWEKVRLRWKWGRKKKAVKLVIGWAWAHIHFRWGWSWETRANAADPGRG
jgi:hypothetical protein